jgi:hypothetical protein
VNVLFLILHTACVNSSVLKTNACIENMHTHLKRNESLFSEILRRVLNRVERMCENTGKELWLAVW